MSEAIDYPEFPKIPLSAALSEFHGIVMKNLMIPSDMTLDVKGHGHGRSCLECRFDRPHLSIMQTILALGHGVDVWWIAHPTCLSIAHREMGNN